MQYRLEVKYSGRMAHIIEASSLEEAKEKAGHIPEAGKEVAPLQQGEYPVWPEPAIFDGVDRSGNPVSHGYSATQVNELLDAAQEARVPLNVDALAQEIRRVDGNHSLGAGALAEALLPWITAAQKETP